VRPSAKKATSGVKGQSLEMQDKRLSELHPRDSERARERERESEGPLTAAESPASRSSQFAAPESARANCRRSLSLWYL
jgi:hypothetical protein